MTQTVENPDGIYPRTRIPITANMPAEDVALVLKAFRQQTNLDSRLGHIRNAIAPLVANLTDQCGSEQQEAARDLSQRIDVLLTILPTCSSRDAALLGLNIGVLAEKIHAMEFEPKVVQVNSTTRKLRASVAERAHSPEEIAQAVRLWKKLHKANPKRKLGSIDKEVAKKFGVTDRTVREWRSERPA